MYRQQAKLIKGGELSRDEKTNFAKKKLKQVRGDMGGQIGRPRKATTTRSRDEINKMRDEAMEDNTAKLEAMGADVGEAKSKGVLRIGETASVVSGFGEVDYITQPQRHAEVDGELVVANNFPYKRRFN